MLHFHAHYLQSVHEPFRFPFKVDRPIQVEMKVKRFGVVCYSDDLIGPGAWFD